MRQAFKFALLVALGTAAASCVAVLDLPAPHQEPVVQLVQLHSDWREPVYGPFAVTYELTIFNPSERTLFVHSVDLHSADTGHYQVARQTRRLNLAVPPFDTVSTRVRVSAWANGGQASAYAPVTIHGTLSCGRGHRTFFEATP